MDGFYRASEERDYIVTHAGPDSSRVASHEYVHRILRHSPAPLPQWFEEGSADFYSTLSVDRGRLRLGEPIEAYQHLLSSEHWLNAAELTSPTNRTNKLFYAESWALVRALNLSPGYRERMPRFIESLSFQEAFGITLEQALTRLRNRAIDIPGTSVAAPEIQDRRITATVLPATTARLALAELALQVDRLDLARKLFTTAARDNPDSPEAAAGLGSLALAEDRPDDARQAMRRAIELGCRDADTFFQLSMLEPNRERGDELLANAAALDPNFAPALFLLGVHATDDGQYAVAVERLRGAVRILPRRSDYWHALGYAQLKMERRKESAESARRALRTAATTEETRMAEELLNPEVPAAQAAKRPSVITPSSWTNRKGDARIEGVLTGVDCNGASARLHVASGSGAAVALEVLRPSEVELVNAPTATGAISCGPQEVRVAVEFLKAQGEVTRIEFK